ncbi:hypothetical protein IIB79_11440 [candidate division KSB1 bacterium]|nr:hypothetical protein [candidate division KSB1 bacterium]
MKFNYALTGILVLAVLSVGLIDCSAQNLQKKRITGDPSFSYDGKRDMTKITYPNGRTIRVKGKWDEKDVEKLHETMLRLEEQLEKLEDIEIYIPDITIDLHDLDFQLHDLSNLINDEILDALRHEDFEDFHIELDDLDFDLSHLDNLNFDFDMSHFDGFNFDFDFSRLDEIIGKVELKLDDIDDIKIRFPERLFDIVPLRELNLRLNGLPNFEELLENNLRFFDWDRMSVKDRKNRKINH